MLLKRPQAAMMQIKEGMTEDALVVFVPDLHMGLGAYELFGTRHLPGDHTLYADWGGFENLV